jgi:hypothetical protein
MVFGVLGSIFLGVALIAAGILLRIRESIPRWQGVALICLGVLMQSWWMLLVVMLFVKVFILREDV